MLLNTYPERGAHRHGGEPAGQSGMSWAGQENLLNSEEFEEKLRLEAHGVRFRIYPTRIQEQVLKRWIGSQRYLYNRKVEELDYQLTLKNFGKFSDRFEEPEETYCEWDQSFSKYRDSARWMSEIPSFVRRNGCGRFKAAMAKWGAGTARKPQYKTRASKQSVLLTAESSRRGPGSKTLPGTTKRELRRVKVGDSLRI